MHKLIERAKKEERNLMEYESLKLLEEYSIPVPKHILAKSANEAVYAAREIRYPVVLKIVSKDILHKTNVGGVKIGLNSDDDVIKAYDEIMKNIKDKVGTADVEGVLVVEHANTGLECIVGMVKRCLF